MVAATIAANTSMNATMRYRFDATSTASQAIDIPAATRQPLALPLGFTETIVVPGGTFGEDIEWRSVPAGPGGLVSHLATRAPASDSDIFVAARTRWMASIGLPATTSARASTSHSGMGGGRSLPQCLQTIAASWISSAQNGHAFIATLSSEPAEPAARLSPTDYSLIAFRRSMPRTRRATQLGKQARDLRSRARDACRSRSR
jgi:hypothetical protein